MMFKFSRLRAVPVATAAVVLFATAPAALAQLNTGSIRGEVKDSTGAKVKGATVTLTSNSTKIVRTATTNDAGIYQFSALDPGDYKVEVAGTGFKSFVVEHSDVALAGTTTLDATLEIGSAGETVEVTAAEPLLDTASASGGQLFDQKMVQTLPNLGRNPFIFEKLDSNVTTTGDPRYVRAEDQTGLSQVSVAGAPIGANNYVVDGIPISRSDGGVTFIPSPDAVSDSKVQANAYDAEVGRTGGGVFNTSLQSGSAQYHGSLWGVTRQTPWAANVWFNAPNSAGVKSPTQDDTTYQYAGAFGGPLPFMHKIKWLDNTFFWVTEEGYRQAQFYPSSSTVTRVPTLDERNGNFSADLVPGAAQNGSNSPGYQLYDPSAPLTNGSRTVVITGNVIPKAYISPAGQAILNAFPLPNTTANGSNYTQLNTFKTRSDMYSGKLTHTFAPWWTSSASYVHLATQEPSGFILGGAVAENATKLLRYNDATALNNTFTINPTTLLTVGYGFNRYYSASFQYSNGYNLGPGGLNLPSGFVSQLQSRTFPTTTINNVTNGRSIGGANGTVQEQSSKNLVVGITKTLNRQNIKVGYVFRNLAFKSTPNSIPSFTFNGEYTAANPASPSTSSPAAFADILMGLPSASSYTLNSGSFNQLANYHAIFLQDDIRLTQKLTMNLGIRYEYELGQKEQNNRFNVGFSPTATYNIPAASGAVAAHGGLLFAGQNGAPIHCCYQSHEKFSPRVGFALQAAPQTVIHAGFGIFFAPVGLAYVAQGYSQQSNAIVNGITPSAPVGVGGNSYLSNTAALYPTGFVQPSGNSLGQLTGLGSSLGTLLDLTKRYPQVQQYSLDIQQDLPFGIDFKLGYVGAHSKNIANTGNINQIPDAVLAADRASGIQLNSSKNNVPNPYYTTGTINGYAPTGVLTNKTITLAQSQLPFPQFTSIAVSQANGYNWYNSLAVKVQKRMTNGLTLLSTYTWASNWDNLWSAGSQVYSTYGPQDIYNPKAEYARALNSVPNRFTAAFSYDLPFGRGKAFGGHVNRWVDEAIGGWQINDEWIAQNGVPLTIQQTNLNTTLGTTGVGGGTGSSSYQRPNLVGDAHAACYRGRPQGRLGVTQYGSEQPYLNPAAFAPAPAYTYGNAPRSLPCAGPGMDTSDVSVNKTFKFTEKVNLQFRAEALNAFNTPMFGNPSLTYVVSQASSAAAPVAATGATQTLGNVTTQINYSRIIQLGGRISF